MIKTVLHFVNGEKLELNITPMELDFIDNILDDITKSKCPWCVLSFEDKDIKYHINLGNISYIEYIKEKESEEDGSI